MKASPTYEDFKSMINKAKEELQHKPVYEAQYVMNYNDLKYVYDLVKKPQHTLYNWRNYISYDKERLQEKIDTSNSEMYRGFSEEEYEKIGEHNGTVEELLIWLSKGYVLLEAFAKEE